MRIIIGFNDIVKVFTENDFILIIQYHLLEVEIITMI